MGFFKTVANSIYSPKFYKDVVNQSLGNAIVYFIILGFVASLLTTLLIVPTLIPLKKQIPTFVNSIVDYYPSKLEIKIKNGEVTTNAKEPYFIPLPGDDQQNQPIKNLVVIDTKTPFSSKKFNLYQSAAWVTSDKIFYKSDNRGDIKAYSLSEIKNVTINKIFIIEAVNKLTPLIKFVTPVLIGLLILTLFVVYLFRFVYLFFLAFIIWIIAKFMKWNFTYMQSYIISIYIATGALLLNLLITSTSFLTGFVGLPFLGTIVTVGLLFANFSNYSSTKKVVSKKR